MKTTHSGSQNRILAPICLGIALLCAIVFLKPTYATYIENKSVLSSLEKEQERLTTEYESLKAIKENVGSLLSPEKLERIQKLAKKYDTSDIMSTVLLNNFTKDSANESALISISSISVGKWKKLPNGLSLGNVSISFQGKTIADIITFITYLAQKTDYVFTLDSISLPIDTAPESVMAGSYGLSISLWVYYYE